MIDLETFARKVRDMRAAQTRYYHTRDVCLLVGARQREVEVDRMVREIFAGCDLFEHARACAGESTPAALRASDELRVTSDEREAAK
ncbi:MAG: hypothetical protein IJQ73_03765 [Kiritimatiellae bacterium]|nr:hypothetical protein [Kiritimatiellia bacterium]